MTQQIKAIPLLAGLCLGLGSFPALAAETAPPVIDYPLPEKKTVPDFSAEIVRDRDTIAALEGEEAALRQASKDVLAASGNRNTAPDRYAIARELNRTARQLTAGVDRLKKADSELVAALVERAEARREVQEDVAATVARSRTGILATVEEIDEIRPELLQAKLAGLAALERSEALAGAITLQNTLRLSLRFPEPLDGSQIVLLLSGLSDILVNAERRPDLDESGRAIELTAAIPYNYDADTIRSQIVGLFSGPEADETVEDMPVNADPEAADALPVVSLPQPDLIILQTSIGPPPPAPVREVPQVAAPTPSPQG